MSNLDQYRYDGRERPDFGDMPTLVKTEGEFIDEDEKDISKFLKEKTIANLIEIENLQKSFRETRQYGLLIILQGLPYSGRSETSKFLKKKMGKGVKICRYDVDDHSHDFLWQMHRKVPEYGKINIMIGSVYSELPDGEEKGASVRAFEKYLKENDIRVVRIFLNVSVKRQKKRLLEVITTKPGGAIREMPSDKKWRMECLERFADAIEDAGSPDSPWYIIPADSKWYSRCMVTEIVRDALRECVCPVTDEDEQEEDNIAGAAEGAKNPEAENAEKTSLVEETIVEEVEENAEAEAVEEAADSAEAEAMEGTETVEEPAVEEATDSVEAEAVEEAEIVEEMAAEEAVGSVEDVSAAETETEEEAVLVEEAQAETIAESSEAETPTAEIAEPEPAEETITAEDTLPEATPVNTEELQEPPTEETPTEESLPEETPTEEPLPEDSPTEEPPASSETVSKAPSDEESKVFEETAAEIETAVAGGKGSVSIETGASGRERPSRRGRPRKKQSTPEAGGTEKTEKPVHRRRMQGPPKTVEETLARRRRRNESEA